MGSTNGPGTILSNENDATRQHRDKIGMQHWQCPTLCQTNPTAIKQ